MSTEQEPRSPGSRGRKEPFRVPGWVVVILGAAVGALVAQVPGAVFGGVLGFFLWRMRG